MIRTFIAVDISEEQRSALREVENEFKKLKAKVKYVDPQNLHVTLRFLGEISEQGLNTVKIELEKALQKFYAFDFSLKSIGVFPSENYVKILWIGIEKGSTELAALRSSIDKFVHIGEKDSRPFSPHVTFGRVKFVQNKAELLYKIKEFEDIEFGTTKVKEIKLKKSELTQTGPIYSDLYSIKLKESE